MNCTKKGDNAMQDQKILFITANKHERDAFLSLLKNKEIVPYKYGMMITYGDFGNYRVAHCHSQQGTKAEAEIKKAIQFTDAQAVILVGIACGGIRTTKENIGDVLISKSIVDYDTHKVTDKKNEHRGDIFPAGDILFRAFTNGAYIWSAETNIEHKAGQILSSAIHLNSILAKEQIFSEFNNYPVGYEMEGASAVRACIDEHITELIIIKGISDLGYDITADDNDNEKTNYQKKASKNAVSLCHYVFSNSDFTGIPKRQNNNSLLSSNTPDLGSVIPIGRDELLKNIEQKFESNHIVLLYGQGGIGKSIVARYYANSNKNKYSLIRSMSFSKNIKNTLITGCQLNIEHFEDYKDDEQFLMIKRHLEKLTEKALLVIDINDENLSLISDYEDLPQNSNIDILFTSRKRELIDCKELPVEELKYEQLKNIFINNAIGFNIIADEERLLKELIEETFKFNTMVVSLAAKTLIKSHMCLFELCQLFKDDRLGQRIDGIIRCFKDKTSYDSKIAEHVLRLFSVAKITDNRYDILRYMSLISYEGIYLKKANEWFSLSNDYSVFNELIEGGWINLTRYSDTNLEVVSMHPIISDAVFLQTEGNSKNCYILLYNIYKCEMFEELLYKKRDLISILSFILLRLDNEKTEIISDLFYLLGKIDSVFCDYNNALRSYKCSLSIRIKIFGINNNKTALSIYAIASSYDDISKYKTAEKLYIKSIEIRNSLSGENNIEIADIYCDLGLLYVKVKEFEKADLCYSKSLEIRRYIRRKVEQDLSISYNNYGGMFYRKKEFETSIHNYELAEKIKRNFYEKNDPSFAILYNNIGVLYDEIENYEKALLYYKKALMIRKKVFGEQSLKTGISLNNLGLLYAHMGNHTKALYFLKKDLKICINTVGAKSEATATTHHNLGYVYYSIEDYGKSIKHYKEAVEIRESLLGNYHCDTISSYKKISEAYESNGDYTKCCEYQDKIKEAENNLIK
jgi:tetratricopeptide (TPR) repeat protein